MNSAASTDTPDLSQPQTLQRSLSWTHAFWFAAGTPALVLFSIGAIAATVGNVRSGSVDLNRHTPIDKCDGVG